MLSLQASPLLPRRKEKKKEQTNAFCHVVIEGQWPKKSRGEGREKEGVMGEGERGGGQYHSTRVVPTSIASISCFTGELRLFFGRRGEGEKGR